LLSGVPEYDDGEYLGSAIRLIGGALPYRDFSFVMPPGITLLLAPLGVLAKLTSTATAMAAARIVVVCVSAAGIALVGLLVRHRGVLATTVACGTLAVFPDAVKTSSTLFLEPFLVLFCLLSALAVFDGDRVTEGNRRLVWGGVAVGFATAIKVWAAFPAVVLLVLVALGRGPRRGLRYLSGALVGLLVPILPFVALAPRAFWNNVVVSQLHQTDVGRVRVWIRLVHMLGITYLTVTRGQVLLLAVLLVAVIVVCAGAAWALLRTAPPALDWFAFGSATIIALSFMLPDEFFPHYSAFLAPFLGLALALACSRLVLALAARAAGRSAWGGAGRALAPVLVAVAACAFVVMMAVQAHDFDSVSAVTPAASIDRQIPAGSCVVTDNASLTIVASRFVSTVPDCTKMVDATGTDMALGNGRNALTGAGRYQAVQTAWLDAFRHAQYVVLSCGPPRAGRCHTSVNRRIPWTPAILAYFESHFRWLGRHSGYMYVRGRPAA
jgi:hypothetical protein